MLLAAHTYPSNRTLFVCSVCCCDSGFVCVNENQCLVKVFTFRMPRRQLGRELATVDCTRLRREDIATFSQRGRQRKAAPSKLNSK